MLQRKSFSPQYCSMDEVQFHSKLHSILLIFYTCLLAWFVIGWASPTLVSQDIVLSCTGFFSVARELTAWMPHPQGFPSRELSSGQSTPSPPSPGISRTGCCTSSSNSWCPSGVMKDPTYSYLACQPDTRSSAIFASSSITVPLFPFTRLHLCLPRTCPRIEPVHPSACSCLYADRSFTRLS